MSTVGSALPICRSVQNAGVLDSVSDTLVLVIKCVDFSPQTLRYKNYYLSLINLVLNSQPLRGENILSQPFADGYPSP